MNPESAPNSDELESIISQEMMRIHNESYGSEASNARTYVHDDLVVSMLDIKLLPAEKVLVAAGRHELVRQVRHGFQVAIDHAFKAAVERATGRKVIAFVSDTHLDPDFTVELFRLDGRV